MGDRCPTDDELERARKNLQRLEEVTRADHVRSVDEKVAQVRCPAAPPGIPPCASEPPLYPCLW